ncbi:TolC family protein [Rubellicoccus peritrichatus]|uniref:TolC family protein n=1 Tax=Rubellicoccus peritrichatus TaxID=3080537 RepID=A0AAQ3LEC2_9BACT|nr:TolC family protein [Puniceicoccus sp. CR14]WOO42043.1 TolC family protein [Puniceicoccus sp. CR14]
MRLIFISALFCLPSFGFVQDEVLEDANASQDPAMVDVLPVEGDAEEEEVVVVPPEIVLPENIFSELDEIIYQMVDRSPSVEIARSRLDEAEGMRLIDRSASMPSINTFAQFNYQTEQRENTGTVDRGLYFWSLDARQPVYQWGAIEARKEMGDLRIDGAKTRNAASFRQLLRDARDLYLQIFQRRVALELARETAAIAEEDFELVRRRHEAGEVTDIVLAEAEVRVFQGEADILNQEQDFAFLQQRLRTITGWTGPIMSNFSLSLRDFLTSPVVEDDPLPRGDPTKSIAYQAIQNNIEIQDREYTIAHARNLPHFSLVAGVFRDQIDSAFLAESEDRTNFFVGGLVTWSIFDGNAATGEKMATMARKRRLEREADMEMQLFQSQEQRLRATLDINTRSIGIASRLLELSNQRLKTAERRHASGAISTGELLLAKSNRNQSQLSLIGAKIDYLITLGDYLGMTRHDPTLEKMESRVGRPDLPTILNPWTDYR